MTTSRMTRALLDRHRNPRVAAFAGCVVVLAGLSGCGSNEARPTDDPPPGTASPADLTQRDRADKGGAKLVPPASDQIEYDKTSRTLKFYELPDSARWMVQVPGAPAVPAAGTHRLPPGTDPDGTLVFYSTPGGQPSSPVSLRQIERAQSKGHTSNEKQ